MKARKSPRNQWKQLHSLKKKSFPDSHFLLNILWPWLLQATYFFPLLVYFVYLTALSVQSIVFLMVSKAYLPIWPSRYRSHAVLQDLDELSSQTLREAASQQQEQSWTQQATVSRHVRTQKGDRWAWTRLAWLEQQSLQMTPKKRAYKQKKPGTVNNAFL